MAQIKKYNLDVTFNIPAAQACSAGYFYGINTSGQAVTADNTVPTRAVGFAITALTSADATAGKYVALCNVGIVDFNASGDILGNGGVFTVGGTVYLGATGQPTTVKPSTATYAAQAVGIAVSTTKAFLNIALQPLTVQAAGNSNIGI